MACLMIPGSLWLSESAETDFKVSLRRCCCCWRVFQAAGLWVCHGGPRSCRLYFKPLSARPCSQEQQHCFCFTVKAFFNGHLVCRGRHPGADKARTVLEANAQKQKSGFPIMAIKAMLSAINIFSPRDREEKNAPLTDTAC